MGENQDRFDKLNANGFLIPGFWRSVVILFLLPAPSGIARWSDIDRRRELVVIPDRSPAAPPADPQASMHWLQHRARQGSLGTRHLASDDGAVTAQRGSSKSVRGTGFLAGLARRNLSPFHREHG
jgi:hypothetical protein